MKCPFCGSDDVEVPMVDIGVGETQCGPAQCLECLSHQEADTGVWVQETLIECPACSKAGGADRPVFHMPPICKEPT